jgi:tRNA(fMet)-specific endonuclease VapC
LTLATGRFLLDTNIIIALLEGDNAVLSNLDQAAEVLIPAVALGELFFGAAKSGRPADFQSGAIRHRQSHCRM